MTKSVERPSVFVHASSVIDEPCTIGAETMIWHFSHVMKNARIGERCVIGQNVYIASGAELGNGVAVQNNVSIYDGVTLEDDVFCGPSCVFTNVINPRAFIERKAEYWRTHVGKGATIGANATILCGVTLGEYSFVGAGSVVTKDVAPHALVTGVPAHHSGFMCRCGVKLEVSGVEMVACASCGATYVVEGETCSPCGGWKTVRLFSSTRSSMVRLGRQVLGSVHP